VNVALDKSLPVKLAQKISQIVTPTGTGKLNAWTPVALSSSGESLAFALDANNNVVAASLITGYNATVSADSTALALTRLAIAAVPTTLNPAAINAAIRATPGYAPLVALINSDLSFGVAPLSDPAVLTDLGAVISPTVTKISSAARAAAKSVPRARATAASGTIVSEIPFTALSDTYGSSGVQITAVANHNILIYNAMPIPWDATTSVGSGGATLGGPTLALAVAPAISLPMYNDAFTLTLAQDASTASRVKWDGIFGAFQLAAASFLPAKCGDVTESLVAQLSGAFQESQSVSWPVIEQAITSFWNAKNTAQLLAPCVPKASPLFFVATAEAIEVIAAAEVALTVGGVVSELTYESHYAGNSYPFTLCGNSAWQVASCATDFQFQDATGTPLSSISLAPGGTEQVSVVALAPKALSVLPADLTITPTGDPSVATINSNDLGLVTVVGGTNVGGSPVMVSASDSTIPPMGVTSSVPLSVSLVWPNVSPPSQTFVIGTQPSLIYLSLVDPTTNKAVPVPHDVQWMQTSGATTLGKNDQTDTGVSWLVPTDGVVPGSIEITATAPDGTPYGGSPATIKLVSTPTTTSVVANPEAPPSGGGPVTLTAAVTATPLAPGGPSTPTGTVTFLDQSGATLCDSVDVTFSGQAVCSANITSVPDTITATYTDPTNVYASSSGNVIVGNPFVLDPTSVNVLLSLTDIGVFGETSGALMSGPGTVDQSCNTPCSHFTAAGGSYGGTLAFTDVWATHDAPVTFSSSFQANVTMTTGSSPTLTATVNWSVPAGPFQADFEAKLWSLTLGKQYVVTVASTCTETAGLVPNAPCDGDFPAVQFSSSAGQIQLTGTSKNGQYVLPAGSYLMSWGVVGTTGASCCLGAPDSGKGPTATATLSLSATFQPSQ
jgi:hypothetical protein